MTIERSAITNYLIRTGWTLAREGSSSVIGQTDWWDSPGGVRISLPQYTDWTDQEGRNAGRRIGEIDGVPPHVVMGTEPPFDPKSDPVLHVNGRGRGHQAAFRDADDARQQRHLKREHSIDSDKALRVAGATTLPEAHKFIHDRLERNH
jgi:hypothetical protein